MAVASSNIDVLKRVRTQNGWLYAQGDQLVVKTGFWDKFWVVIEDLRSYGDVTKRTCDLFQKTIDQAAEELEESLKTENIPFSSHDAVKDWYETLHTRFQALGRVGFGKAISIHLFSWIDAKPVAEKIDALEQRLKNQVGKIFKDNKLGDPKRFYNDSFSYTLYDQRLGKAFKATFIENASDDNPKVDRLLRAVYRVWDIYRRFTLLYHHRFELDQFEPENHKILITGLGAWKVKAKIKKVPLPSGEFCTVEYEKITLNYEELSTIIGDGLRKIKDCAILEDYLECRENKSIPVHFKLFDPKDPFRRILYTNPVLDKHSHTLKFDSESENFRGLSYCHHINMRNFRQFIQHRIDSPKLFPKGEESNQEQKLPEAYRHLAQTHIKEYNY